MKLSLCILLLGILTHGFKTVVGEIIASEQLNIEPVEPEITCYKEEKCRISFRITDAPANIQYLNDEAMPAGIVVASVRVCKLTEEEGEPTLKNCRRVKRRRGLFTRRVRSNKDNMWSVSGGRAGSWVGVLKFGDNNEDIVSDIVTVTVLEKEESEPEEEPEQEEESIRVKRALRRHQRIKHQRGNGGRNRKG